MKKGVTIVRSVVRTDGTYIHKDDLLRFLKKEQANIDDDSQKEVLRALYDHIKTHI